MLGRRLRDSAKAFPHSGASSKVKDRRGARGHLQGNARKSDRLCALPGTRRDTPGKVLGTDGMALSVEPLNEQPHPVDELMNCFFMRLCVFGPMSLWASISTIDARIAWEPTAPINPLERLLRSDRPSSSIPCGCGATWRVPVAAGERCQDSLGKRHRRAE